LATELSKGAKGTIPTSFMLFLRIKLSHFGQANDVEHQNFSTTKLKWAHFTRGDVFFVFSQSSMHSLDKSSSPIKIVVCHQLNWSDKATKLFGHHQNWSDTSGTMISFS
jgi:hypothetical protein